MRELTLVLRPAELYDIRFESSTRPRFELGLMFKGDPEDAIERIEAFSAESEEQALEMCASILRGRRDEVAITE